MVDSSFHIPKSMCEQGIIVGIPAIREDHDVMIQTITLKKLRYMINEVLMLIGFQQAFERNLITEIAFTQKQMSLEGSPEKQQSMLVPTGAKYKNSILNVSDFKGKKVFKYIPRDDFKKMSRHEQRKFYERNSFDTMD